MERGSAPNLRFCPGFIWEKCFLKKIEMFMYPLLPWGHPKKGGCNNFTFYVHVHVHTPPPPPPPSKTLYVYMYVIQMCIALFASQESLHSVGNWKHEMERYNVGPRRRHSVWMMAGHKITDQDYTGFISQANVRGNISQ